MKNTYEQELLNSNEFFNDYFNNMDLNSDMKKFYNIIEDEDLQSEIKKEEKLTKLRNENYNRYNDIDLTKFEDLPKDLQDLIDDILKVYDCINSKKLLKENYSTALESKKLLDHIYRNINRLERIIKTILKELVADNKKQQKNFSLNYFESLDIDEALKKDLILRYNELVLFSSGLPKDIYDELKREVNRKKQIKDILRLINVEEENKNNLLKQDKLKVLNQKINKEIEKYREKLNYLEDLMPENSKHLEEFNNFKEFCNKLIAYDDTNYNNARQTYEILSDKNRFNIYINNFEELFIQELEDRKQEEQFVYEKVGVKNLKISLNYIAANYIDSLSDESKKIIKYVYTQINSKDCDLKKMEQLLGLVVRRIWKNTITDVHTFNNDEDYYFICSNNQFIDEKYQTILITKKEVNRVEDYGDYQIGFICDYNDNIMYITENDDIMTVDYNDMSNLKTPVQLEQEFINFKVSNRIALNGFKTKISAVYYINDGNMDKYRKAVELSNMYKLPLIELKKDK